MHLDAFHLREPMPLRLLMSQALKAAFSAFIGVLSTLLAFEVTPMAGLIVLIAFEAVTDLTAKERAGQRWRARIGMVMMDRLLVLSGMAAGIVYANATGYVWIKAAIVAGPGGILLLLGWYRLTKRAPLMKLVVDAMLTQMKGRGLDLTIQDEEGKRLRLAGMLQDATVLDPAPLATDAPPPDPAPDAPPQAVLPAP
jgi:hypothetical protein